MKTLLILRHAKSSRENAYLSDHERPLNARGRKAARRMGRLLADEGLLPDCVLGSTAVRVRETVELVAQDSAYRGKIEYLPALYLAAPEAYLAALRGVPNDCRCVLVVGHNPGLEDLLADLTGEHEHLPTAALAQVELDIAAWSEVNGNTRGKLIRLWRPKELE